MAKPERVTRFDGQLGAASPARDEPRLDRVRLALDGALAQQHLTLGEARQLDAVIAVRVADAVARADFACGPLPDFAAVSPDLRRVLDALDTRASQGMLSALDSLRDALALPDAIVCQPAVRQSAPGRDEG